MKSGYGAAEVEAFKSLMKNYIIFCARGFRYIFAVLLDASVNKPP